MSSSKTLSVFVAVLAVGVGAVVVLGNGADLQGRLRGAAKNQDVQQEHGADLVLSAIGQNAEGKLLVTVENRGDAPVSADVDGKLNVEVDNGSSWVLSWKDYSDLYSPHKPVKIELDALQGAHHVKACVDSTMQVSERNENNNCMAVQLGEPGKTLESLPDLTIKSITLAADRTLTIDVANIGKSEVTINTGHTFIDYDDKSKWTYSWSTLSDLGFLKAGGHSILQPEILKEGHKVKACVDATKVVEEANEANNCLEVSIPAPVQP